MLLIDPALPLWINISVIIANILNLIYNIPQMWKTYKLKTTRDISGWFLILRTIASVIWVLYSYYISNFQYLFASVVTIIANLFISYYKILEMIEKEETEKVESSEKEQKGEV